MENAMENAACASISGMLVLYSLAILKVEGEQEEWLMTRLYMSYIASLSSRHYRRDETTHKHHKRPSLYRLSLVPVFPVLVLPPLHSLSHTYLVPP